MRDADVQVRDRVVTEVGLEFGVLASEVFSRRRTERIALVRHVIWFLLCTDYGFKRERTAALFGWTHSGVTCGVQATQARLDTSPETRARVEHPFLVLRRLWGFAKVRYRGLAKNATRSFVVLGLANIYLARQRLVA